VDGQFLQLLKAETDGLLTITIMVEEEKKLVADICRFICNDYINDNSEQWNAQRRLVAEYACYEVMFPQCVKWIKDRLGQSAMEYISMKCLNTMSYKLSMTGYKSNHEDGPKVLSLSWGSGDRGSITYGVILNENGDLKDSIMLDKLETRGRAEDVKKLAQFIGKHHPDCIVIGGFKPNTKIHLAKIIKEEVLHEYREFREDSAFKPALEVMLLDDEVARIFMNSKLGIREFPDKEFPLLVRYCVSLGRYCQNPLIEYAGLFNQDEDIKNVRLDPLQSFLPDETIVKIITRSFITVVNQCGVDINAAVLFPHLAHVLQFVSGLGPRKAQAMIAKIQKSGGKLECRADLIQKSICGGTVFINCASFIRVREIHFRTGYYENPIDVLDDTRVHPEDYELARKMAADALDYDDAVLEDDESPSAHVQELMEGDVEKLNLLLLDDYAVELERRIHAPKKVCLNDIKEELMKPYKDLRRPFKEPSPEEIFSILTGESRMTLYEGAVVSAVVVRIKERLMYVQLGSGLEGIIHANNTDVSYGERDLANIFQVNQALLTSVIKLNYDRISVDLSACRTEIENTNAQVRIDHYFDKELQREHNSEKKTKKRNNEKQTRTIQHPYWRAVNYKKAEQYLDTRPRGEVVVRPSGKGNDHISLTWKVDEGIYQHIGNF
jgi:transcription elongation factor SPT6